MAQTCTKDLPNYIKKPKKQFSEIERNQRVLKQNLCSEKKNLMLTGVNQQIVLWFQITQFVEGRKVKIHFFFKAIVKTFYFLKK